MCQCIVRLGVCVGVSGCHPDLSVLLVHTKDFLVFEFDLLGVQWSNTHSYLDILVRAETKWGRGFLDVVVTMSITIGSCGDQWPVRASVES